MIGRTRAAVRETVGNALLDVAARPTPDRPS